MSCSRRSRARRRCVLPDLTKTRCILSVCYVLVRRVNGTCCAFVYLYISYCSIMSTVLPYPLPDIFRYRINDVNNKIVTLYAEINSIDECDRWINEFSNITSTKWIVRRTKPASTRITCR